jgi:hypothetical protein
LLRWRSTATTATLQRQQVRGRSCSGAGSVAGWCAWGTRTLALAHILTLTPPPNAATPPDGNADGDAAAAAATAAADEGAKKKKKKKKDLDGLFGALEVDGGGEAAVGEVRSSESAGCACRAVHCA